MSGADELPDRPELSERPMGDDLEPRLSDISRNIAATEFARFRQAIEPASQEIFEKEGVFVVSDGKIHNYLQKNDDGTFTISMNDRNPNSPKSWVADLANSHYALRYLLFMVGDSMRPRTLPDLIWPTQPEELAKSSVLETPPAEKGLHSRREKLFIDGDYAGTFSFGVASHSAVTASYVLRLTFEEIAAAFRDPARLRISRLRFDHKG